MLYNTQKGFGALKGFLALAAFLFLILFAWRVYPMLVSLIGLSNPVNTTLDLFIRIGIIMMLLFNIVFIPYNILYLDGQFNIIGGIVVQLMFIVCAVLVTAIYPVFVYILEMFTPNIDSMLLSLFINIVLLFVLYGVPIISFFYYEEKLRLMFA